MARKPRKTAAFSLFTFLDVMLCTLGALIIVLICVVRTAQIKNAEEPPPNSAEVVEIESQRETVEWRAQHLAASRDQTRGQLRDRRLELSHIEEHSRRLRAQLAELETAKTALANDRQHNDHLEQLRAEVNRLAELAAAAERDLDDAHREAQTRRPSYAVVPYEGPSQTMRRPLYIECTADRIILQPENIELAPEDFTGPIGPGNPLASGLRTAREYLTGDQNNNYADGGEPYPLLLVRPDGVEAYYHAREAMSSWGSEFGYEFIDQDWKLEFREPQAAMVDAMRVAVDEARIRQRALARAAPSFYAERKAPRYYRAAPGGGVMQDSGPSERDDPQPRGAWGSGKRGPSYGRGAYAGGGSGRGTGSGGTGSGAAGGRGGARGDRRIDGTGAGGTSADGSEDLASIYGAAASAPPGRGLGNGAGYGLGTGSATGQGVGPEGAAQQGTGNGPVAGGINSGPGRGTNMLADGTGSANGAAPGGGYGSSLAGSGTGTGANGGGDSFLAMGGGTDPSAGPAFGNGVTPSGTSATPSSAGAAGKRGEPLGGFSGNANGTGGPTLPGGAEGQPGGYGGNAASGSLTRGGGGTAAPGAATADAAGQATGGDPTSNRTGEPGGNAGAGEAGGEPGGAQSATGQKSTNGGRYGKAGGQGKAGQQGAGVLGMQGGGQQGGGSVQGGGSPGGQAGMVSAGSSGGGSSSPSMSGGSPSLQMGSPQPTASNSIADSRGKNWSLPEEARHTVPISRPVRIECRVDKLVLVTEQPSAPGQEIPMNERTEESMEELVTSVWQRVEAWGSAGRGMYWRPVLSVDVAPGAEGRYADLQTLLADSGLEVKPAAEAPVQVARPKRKLTPW